jgi:negative regulator of flagellin synthesis FlgM
MRINGPTPSEPSQAVKPADAARAEPAAAARPAPGGATAELQSGVLQPALAAMREMPDVDQVRVAELRDALARGEIAFDAGKLAKLIADFHGKKP